MYRSLTKLVGLGMIALACGSPGDLDRTQFPAPGDTGYANDPALGGAAGSGGSSGLPPGGSGAAGGSVAAGGTASGSGGTAGSGQTAQGGSAQGGSSQTGQGGSGAAPTGGCPDDISVLLNRPSTQGGCQGGGCHAPGGQRPDLASPGVASRLLNVMSSCNSRPYISATDSFLEEKLVEPKPDCGGLQMPFFMVASLSAADKQCILDWIDEVASGM
jgi:hypothetical protein